MNGPFTDNDLKELKELITATIYWSPKIPALIARLEAAEHLNNAEPCPTNTEDCGNCELCRAITRWREAAGK